MVGQVVALGELRRAAVALEEPEGRHRLEDRRPHGVVVDRARHHRDERLARGELGRRHLLDVQRPAGVLVAGRQSRRTSRPRPCGRSPRGTCPGPRSRRRSAGCGPRRGWPRGSGPCGRAPSVVRVGRRRRTPAGEPSGRAACSVPPYDSPHTVIRLTGAGTARSPRHTVRSWPRPPSSRRRALLGGGGVAGRSAPRRGWSIAAPDHAGPRCPCTARPWPSRLPGYRELVPAGTSDAVVPGTRVLAARPQSAMLLEDEQAWLETRAPLGAPARLDGGDDLLRSALLDLRALSVGLPVSVAGWTDRWRYAWPRDVSFVASALARCGHPEHAGAAAGVPPGGPADRRLVRGPLRHRHPPRARRPGRAARRVRVGRCGGLASSPAAAPDRAAELLGPLRPHARALRPAPARRRSTPAPRCRRPSSDYWELVEDTADPRAPRRPCSPACAARARCCPSSARWRSPTARRRGIGPAWPPRCGGTSAPHGYPRLLGGSAADAAVTFLVAPIGPSAADARCSARIERAQASMGRPAGGLAPGASWKNDGISWTPETALFAAAWAATGPPLAGRVAAGLARRPPHGCRVLPREGAPRRAPGSGGPAGVDGSPRRHRPARAGATA